MNEATVLDNVVRYFDNQGAVLFVDPGSDGSYDKVRKTVLECPDCELNDSITIAGRTPDIVGILGRNELIAVEAKGDEDIRKGIGQATDYRQGVHKSYLAAEVSALNTFDDAAHAAGVGAIPVEQSGVIDSQLRAPNPQIAGSKIDSTRRAVALKTTEFESGRFVFPSMYRPENALLPVLAIGIKGESQKLSITDCKELIRDSNANYGQAPENPIRLAKTLQLVQENAKSNLQLTDYGQCSYRIVLGLHSQVTRAANTNIGIDSEFTIDTIDNYRDHDALIAFLRDRYLATPPIRLLVRILAEQENSRMEVSQILSAITHESPDVFSALFCRDDTELRALLNDTSVSGHEFRRQLLDLTMVTYLYNFVNQLQVIGILSDDSDKTDSTQDLELGELYWEWNPDQIGVIGAI
jgi:hypothetical protein